MSSCNDDECTKARASSWCSPRLWLGLASVALLCCGGYVWLDWCVNTPHSIRPLFHEWRPGGVGRGYVLNQWAWDAHGTCLIHDGIINMLALFPAADEQPGSVIVIRGYPDTDVHIGAFVGTVSAKPDSLLVQYPGEDAAYFDLDPDVANAMAGSALRDEPGDLVAYVVEHYSGGEANRLREYLTGHQQQSRIHTYRDAYGVDIIADSGSNVLIVAARRNVFCESGQKPSPDRSRAALSGDAGRPTQSVRAANVLRWVGAKGQYELRLADGVADEVVRALEQARTEDGLLEDALTIVVAEYRGPDRAHLESLDAEFRASSP